MAQWIEWIANAIIIIGLIFMALGVVGIFRFKDYYSRVLVSAKVDAVGFLTVMLGLLLRNGFSFFSAKILIVVIFFVVTNPIGTHAITRSAFLSGYRIKEESERENV